MEAEQKSALFPTYARFPITLVKGKGSRVWDDQGNVYLDMISGIAVNNLGHVPEPVKKALHSQLDQLWHVSNLFEIPQQEKLARLLTERSGLDAAFFCNSGAEANEAAIKLARRYQQEVLKNGRYEIITFEQSFHGRTLATLTATGQEKVKTGFHPLPQGFVHAPYNDAEALAGLISERTAAIMLELIQGEGGVRPANPDFVREAAELCEQHDLLLIADEVQTGMGRTGAMFSYEHYGITPDIVTLAKGLGSGFPIGAVLGKERLRAAFIPGSHGSTFGGTPLAAAAGIATFETIAEQDLCERAAVLGEKTLQLLKRKLSHNPFVKDIRGKGFLIGVEYAHPVAERLQEMREQGVLAISAGANVIRLLPNLLISEADLNEGIDVLCTVLDEHASAFSSEIKAD